MHHLVMRRLLTLLVCLWSTGAFAQGFGGLGSPGFSQVGGSSGGGGSSAFLSSCSGSFTPTNYAIDSNDFTAATGHWTAQNNIAALPTITTVSDTLPDGTTGNVSRVVFGATTSGTTQFSVLSYANSSLLGQFTMSFPIWAKVISGSGTLFTSISRGTIFFDAPITNDGAWHKITSTTPSNPFGVNNIGLQIGLNQFDVGQRTVTPSITVELTGAALVGTQFAPVLPYSAVKIGGPLATTGTIPLQGSFSVPCPAHVAFRDPLQLTPYSGNPIVSEAGEPWRDGGVGNPIIQSQFQSGGFYWEFNNCTSSAGHQDWMAFCLFKSTDGLAWTEDTLNAPYLQTFGSILAKPTINGGGTGFTAGSGTATWTGTGCSPVPVIAVTVASTTISAATPSPNNGIGTGACPSPAGSWPGASGFTWSYSGVGGGSGAAFTFASVIGTGSGPSWWQLHPAFLPFGCWDSTNALARPFCIIYGAQTSANNDFLYVAWATTVDGVYTPIGCVGPGECTGATPVAQLLQPTATSNQGIPTVFNIGGATGTNYIITISGGSPTSGAQINVWSTPANSSTTTSGNTLTFVTNTTFTLVSGVDWYSPNSSTSFADPFVFQNHCGFFELYYTALNTSSPGAPFTNSKKQIVAEAVTDDITKGYWFQNPNVILPTSSSLYGGAEFYGDQAAIEIGGQLILSGNFDNASNVSRAMALIGPQGTCP